MIFRNTSSISRPVTNPPFVMPTGLPATPAGTVSTYNTQSFEPSTFLWNIPMAVLTALIINHFGRPFEFVLVGLKIPFVISLIGILVVLTTRALKGFLSAPGKPLALLLLWMTASCPFSFYRSGSLSYLLYFVALQVGLFLLAAGALRSFRDIKRIGYLLLGTGSAYLLLGARSFAGRFSLAGTFGNSDDVALYAGFLIPFLVLLGQQLRNPLFKGLVLIGGSFALLRVIGFSGTRTSILGIAAMLLVYFIYANAFQRIAIIAAAVVGLLVMLAILPDDILARFATTFKSIGTESISEGDLNEAYASALQRRDLWKDAIHMAVTHPILGVGPGEFTDFRFNTTFANVPGGHKPYLPSHNTYLQIASEDGIPSLIYYVLFLAMAFKILRSAMKLNRPGSHPDWELGHRLAICLQAALVYFAVCAFFMTCERHPHQYLLAGMAIALERISRLYATKRTEGPAALPSQMPTFPFQTPVSQKLSANQSPPGPQFPSRRSR